MGAERDREWGGEEGSKMRNKHIIYNKVFIYIIDGLNKGGRGEEREQASFT